MPIVRPDKPVITVEIQGKIDDLLKDVNTLDKRFDEFSAHNKAAANTSSTVAKQASLSWTDFRSMYSTVLDVVRSGQQVWAATGQKYIEYVDQVRAMSTALGSSTEEASRLIQVADDVFLSYDKLALGMKLAQKQGIDPSIEGMAKLSDAYLKLAPGVERTQFLLKTFGESGQDMAKIMLLGGDAIRKQSAAIADGLIITQKAADEQLKYKQSLDALKDSFDAMTYKVMPPVITALKDYFAVWTAGIAMMEGGAAVLTGEKTMTQWLAETSIRSQELYNTFMGLDEAQAQVAESSGEAGDELGGEAEALKKAEAAAKKAADALEKVSERNKGILSLTEKMGDNQKKYAEDHAEAVQKIADAQIDLNKATDEYGAKSDEAFAAREGLDEARAGLAELEVAWHEATLRMTYDMIVTKLSIDGLTDAEFEAAIQIGITSGIYSQETANMARDMWAMTDAVVNGIHQVERLGSAASMTASQVAKINIAGASRANYGGSGFGNTPSKRDAGGSGMAGTPYMIGTGAQPEVFIPSTNGNFIPNADKKGIGTTYNIVINNPKKETAENSIRQELKKLSYIGVAA